MKILMILIASTSIVYADVIRPQCQTEESRGMRLVSQAMDKVAAESMPVYPSCNGCTYTIDRPIEDLKRTMAERFRLEARASLMKARALEATKCPQWEQAIMNNAPVTDEEKQKVRAEFDARVFKRWSELNRIQKWQSDNPQCKHVDNWSSFGTGDESSPTDLSGNYNGKKGWCAMPGSGPSYRGSEDDMTMWSPDTNPRISLVACQDAMSAFGFDTPHNAKSCQDLK